MNKKSNVIALFAMFFLLVIFSNSAFAKDSVAYRGIESIIPSFEGIARTNSESETAAPVADFVGKINSYKNVESKYSNSDFGMNFVKDFFGGEIIKIKSLSLTK